MSTELTELFSSLERSGVLRAEPFDRASLSRAAEESDLRVLHVDCSTVASKRSFLRQVSLALDFPAESTNWNSFEDWMRDLSWVKAGGYAVLLDGCERFAQQEPGEFRTALSILQDVAMHWQARQVRFFVLVRGAQGVPLPLVADV